MQHTLTMHETMELHEILNFKTICMAKAKLIQGLVFDQDLKALMEKEVQISMNAVHDIQMLLGSRANPVTGVKN